MKSLIQHVRNNKPTTLSLIDKLNYVEMLNQGSYNIVINLTRCFETIYPGLVQLLNESDLILKATVESTRSNNDSPHVISAWLFFQPDIQKPIDPAEIQSQMLMEITIYHNVSPTYPYGHFDINLAQIEDAGKSGGTVGEENRLSKFTYRSLLINNLPAYKSADYASEFSQGN